MFSFATLTPLNFLEPNTENSYSRKLSEQRWATTCSVELVENSEFHLGGGEGDSDGKLDYNTDSPIRCSFYCLLKPFSETDQ